MEGIETKLGTMTNPGEGGQKGTYTLFECINCFTEELISCITYVKGIKQLCIYKLNMPSILRRANDSPRSSIIKDCNVYS